MTIPTQHQRPPRVTHSRLRAVLPSRDIAGIRFDSIECAQVVTAVHDAITRRRRLLLSFANAEFAIEQAANPALESYLHDCDLVLADGSSIVATSRVLTGPAPLPGRVTGTDFVHALGAAAAQYGYRLAFVGGKPGIAAQAAEKLTAQYPGVQVVCCLDGYGDIADASAAIETLNAAAADVIMVCLGNPRQEAWIAANAERLTAPVLFGNGGALDFTAGVVKRAPAWLQRVGLEWTWRLVQDPSLARVRRQARLPRFFWLAWRHARARRKASHDE